MLHFDSTLSSIIEKGVNVVLRKNATIGSAISPNLFISEPIRNNSQTWLMLKGFYNCNKGRCGACKYVKKTNIFPYNNTINNYKIKTFITCETDHVVYIIHCNACNLIYVGCTIRRLKLRIAEHILAINKNMNHHSGAVAHFLQVHEGHVDTLCFYAIEHVKKTIRGGDWRKALLAREAYWILRLGTRTPYGLNLKNDLFLIY